MAEQRQGRLQRSVGFHGLLFVSLGSIIGSGWLLGALEAAKAAGPASILSWMIAAALLSLLALVYAELGATYPVAGGAGRYPYYSHGPWAGFVAGWSGWLQAVLIPPVEALAAIGYLNSTAWVHDHFAMLGADGLLNGTGIVVAVVLMALFTGINLAGAKFLSDSNTIVVIWKTVVPVLALCVVAGMRFDTANFTAGGGFMPHGWHGVFAALSGGVVFGLQGFEQAAQLAGEARDPAKDLSRAIILSMAIGAVLYSLLQLVMVAAFDPQDLAHGWDAPMGNADTAIGAWYTLALALGAAWLAKILLVDAVISPSGTGVVYIGTTARLSYALGEEREMPSALASTNAKGVPVVSIIVAAVVGCVAFGPFKSWGDLVDEVSAATAIMYAFAPLSLAALHRLDPDRPRPYRVPIPKVLLPASFCSANLILYWSGFQKVWVLVVVMAAGVLLFAAGAWIKKTSAWDRIRSGLWIAPWLGGHVVIGALGRYGKGYEVLPDWVDVAVVLAFSLAIYYAALATTLTREQVAVALAKDSHQLDAT